MEKHSMSSRASFQLNQNEKPFMGKLSCNLNVYEDTVLKDCNLRLLNEAIDSKKTKLQKTSVVSLEMNKTNELNAIVKRDAKFLRDHGIMDYSLFLSVESKMHIQRQDSSLNSSLIDAPEFVHLKIDDKFDQKQGVEMKENDDN